MNMVKEAIRGVLRRRGLELIPAVNLYEWQLKPATGLVYNASSELPDGARDYLRGDHPRLLELERRYSACDPAVTTPYVWREGFVRDEDVAFFRGDNAYVWQVRGDNMNRIGYIAAFYYLHSIDKLHLLDRLTEDDAFGNFTFEIGNRAVSRDLLDSLLELYFLDRHLNLAGRTGFNILDIGAGYGRLAHRATQSFPGIANYFCTDAIARSTFISEYYLRYRQSDRAKVIPLDEIDRTLATTKVDLAVNIHSFSECSTEAIRWWIALLARRGVKHLMIVPNSSNCGGALLQTNDLRNFQPVVEEFGYRLMAKDPKYGDPAIQEFAIGPTYYYLFELS
jgi:hypothetical protein